MALFPRFRSKNRDQESDLQRRLTVESALNEVIAGIEREKHGLVRRLKEAQDRASALVGNDDYHEREPAKNDLLTLVENELVGGGQRLRAIEAQHEIYKDLRSRLIGSLNSEAQSTVDASGSSKQ